MRRSWALTRAARARTTGICPLGTAVVTVAFLASERLGTYAAHGAGLLMPAATDDNVWVAGVLVRVTPVAVALVLLPLVPAPAGVVLACPRERLAARVTPPSQPSGSSQRSLTDI
jgi:hypothetical protein